MRRAFAPLALALAATLASAPPAAAATVYLAFGDSITLAEGFDPRCPAECGYPARLQRRLRDAGQDAVVENHGLGGERTDGALTRLDAVLDGGGDVLLLMEGTNDVTRGLSRETTMFNLAEMARKAADHGLETVHATLIPRHPPAPVDSENLLNEQLAWSIRELAATEERRLADPFEVFSQIPDVFTRYYDQTHPGDPVGHPNAEGFDILADVWFDVLTGGDEVPPVLGFVSPADGEEQVSGGTAIRLRLFDFGSGVDLSGTRLFVDGVQVPYTSTGDGLRLDLVHLPPSRLDGTVTVGVQTRDLAIPPNGWTREVASFAVEGGLAALEDAEVAADVARVDLVKGRLQADAPGTAHPVVAILTPSRGGGVTVSAHTTQHDERGAAFAAPESRLVATLQHGSWETRDDVAPTHTTTLARVDPASDLVPAGDAGVVRLTVTNGLGATLAVDNVENGAAAAASAASGSLESAVQSSHQQELTGRDWLAFDLVHELMTVQLCDDVSAATSTCYDAYVVVNRRPDPDRLQMRFGCLQPAEACGEGIANLTFQYDAAGQLAKTVAEFIRDGRFTLEREVVVWFKRPTAPGETWIAPGGALIHDNQGNVNATTLDLKALHASAAPSRLDPRAD